MPHLQRLPEPLAPASPPGTPNRFLAWIARRQWRSIALGVLYDTIWLSGLALIPWAVGRAIDEGVIPGDVPRLLLWAGVLLWLQLQHAAIQGVRDRGGIINWSRAAFRTLQLLGRQVAGTGQAVSRRMASGEVAATAAGDAFGIAHLYYMIGALTAAMISYAVVSVLLLTASVPLGLMVLLGVPVFSGLFFVLVRPLRARQNAQREASGRMTTLAADTVTGLRVLRGIGGEGIFLGRYRERSAETRAAGITVAWPLAAIEGLQLLVGGILVVGLTWVGALFVRDGAIEPGELVSFYGYAGFLVLPIRLMAGAVSMYTRALVGAARITGVLAVRPLADDDPRPRSAPDGVVDLHDETSGLRVAAGRLVGLVADRPEEAAAVADRVARLGDDPAGVVRWGGIPTRRLAIGTLRERIVLADPEPFFFTGTLRDQLDPHGEHDDARLSAAIHAAAAEDVLEALPDGLDAAMTERARTFSGGQRQRLGIARALLSDADLLVLVAPTGAVDAHTEGRIAGRIGAARAGRSTLVVTASPLLLARMDEVVLLRDGRVAETGTHAGLMETSAGYRAIVAREEGIA
jgi:ABC-type multidrug transport system fused ATPase/permease subunit